MTILRRCSMFLLAALALAASGDPWKPGQALPPTEFAKVVETGNIPKILMVGPRLLYNGAHIKGAVFAGPTETADGMALFEKQLTALPKSAEIVLYCGCCPMDQCPRIRPAFAKARELGYTNVKILDIPTNLHTDWVAKGHPIEKGGASR